MMYRIPFLAVVAVALVALARVSVRAADDKVHEVTIVKAGDGKITMTMKGVDQKHAHDVAKDAAITLDGKKAKLEDLKEGHLATVTMDAKYVVTKVEAQSKPK